MFRFAQHGPRQLCRNTCGAVFAYFHSKLRRRYLQVRSEHGNVGRVHPERSEGSGCIKTLGILQVVFTLPDVSLRSTWGASVVPKYLRRSIRIVLLKTLHSKLRRRYSQVRSEHGNVGRAHSERSEGSGCKKTLEILQVLFTLPDVSLRSTRGASVVPKYLRRSIRVIPLKTAPQVFASAKRTWQCRQSPS
jgi:hypothetical protein